MNDRKDLKTPEKDNSYIALAKKRAAADPTKLNTKRRGLRMDAINWLTENGIPFTIHTSKQASGKAAAANQSANQARVEVEAEAATQAKTSKLADIYARAKMPKITAAGTAKFLLIPISLRGFHFTAHLLTQAFAQVLVGVGLLSPNHPARTSAGAKIFNLSQILEEARLNLLPLKFTLEAFDKTKTSGLSVLAVKQYAIFTSLIAFLITGCATLLMAFLHIIFGAHAYAQSSPPTTGPGIGIFNIAAGNGDMGSNVIDNIFGTGSATTSIVSSGLGGMFSFYSTTILVFAGLILLWIIISSVTETARTGVPLGKNFNHVWAPIRLVVALGLLVPLSSGLNSGQFIVLSLAKWGSTQASQVWKTFSNSMILPSTATGASTATSGTGQIAGGLQSVPVNLSAERDIANNVFNSVLCQDVANDLAAVAAANGAPSSPPVVQNSPRPNGMAPPVGSVNTAGNNIDVSTSNQIPTTQVSWDNGADAGSIDCGAVYFASPSNAANSVPNQAATMAVTSLLTDQQNELGSFAGAVSDLADQIVQAEISQHLAGQTTIPLPANLYNTYQTLSDQYLNTRASDLSHVLNTYNTNLAQNMSNIAVQYGWAYAPVWLMSIIEQNDEVANIASTQPTYMPPDTTFAGNDTASGLWSYVQGVEVLTAPSNATANTSSTAQSSNMIIRTLTDLTSTTNKDPMAVFTAYGHQLLAEGFQLITPPNMVACYDDPTTTGVDGKPDCRWLQTELAAAQAKAPAGGAFNGFNHMGGGQRFTAV